MVQKEVIIAAVIVIIGVMAFSYMNNWFLNGSGISSNNYQVYLCNIQNNSEEILRGNISIPLKYENNIKSETLSKDQAIFLFKEASKFFRNNTIEINPEENTKVEQNTNNQWYWQETSSYGWLIDGNKIRMQCQRGL